MVGWPSFGGEKIRKIWLGESREKSEFGRCHGLSGFHEEKTLFMQMVRVSATLPDPPVLSPHH